MMTKITPNIDINLLKFFFYIKKLTIYLVNLFYFSLNIFSLFY